jgi:hypothetical protein
MVSFGYHVGLTPMYPSFDLDFSSHFLQLKDCRTLCRVSSGGTCTGSSIADSFFHRPDRIGNYISWYYPTLHYQASCFSEYYSSTKYCSSLYYISRRLPRVVSCPTLAAYLHIHPISHHHGCRRIHRTIRRGRPALRGYMGEPQHRVPPLQSQTSVHALASIVIAVVALRFRMLESVVERVATLAT